MNLLTSVNIDKAQRQITYNDKIMLIGSCFSEHIYHKMQSAYLHAQANPFGILYNPMSIVSCIKVLLSPSELPKAFYSDGLWHSWLHHGSFSQPDLKSFEKAIEQSLSTGRKILENADIVIFTLGSAWIYELKTDHTIVGNCHKMPQDMFFRRRLEVNEIVTEFCQLLQTTSLRNKQIIFTISPIRHIKDGLHENQLSKSTLFLAIDKIQKELKDNVNIDYFPAYEIVTDELRDYRFYASDMLHPSELAIEYIWQRFSETYFSEQTQNLIRQANQLYLRREHRILHPETESAKKFISDTERLANQLKNMGVDC